MNLPPHIKEKVKAAETIEDLKAAITDILDEYNFGILSLLEERISALEAGIE